VLTGLVSAAGGSAQVAGFDVVEGARGPNALAMGVCPQHDLLFPLLTANETMLLFCGLKNLPKAAWAAEVESTLASVNLADVADRLTSTFSGGMKRRLSVALAALGRPPLLIFDEPSTGLDPLARAELLQLLQGLKKTSGLLLTTHSMSEASALGDRVAIMAGGLLVAVGSTVELTSRYGRGYSLSLTLVDDTAATFAAVEAAVRERAPNALLALRDGVAVACSVPFSAVDVELPSLLEWADSTRGEPILEYGVSGPTLEDAFIAVSAASHFNLAEQALGGGQGDVDGAADAGDDGYAALADDASPVPKSTSRLVHALCVKNFTLISRARGLCICQLVTPLLILGLLLTLEILLKVEVGLTAVAIIPPIYLPLNIPLSLLQPDSAFALRAAIGTIARGASSDASFPLAGATRALAAHTGALRASNEYAIAQGGSPTGTCMSFYLASIDAALGVNQTALESAVGTFPRDILPLPAPTTPPSEEVGVQGFLQYVPSYWCQLRNSTVTPSPFFDARGFSNGDAIDAELFSDLLALNRADSTLLQKTPPCTPPFEVNCPAFILPDGAWILHDLSVGGGGSQSAGALSATLQINTAASTSYHRPNGLSRPPPPAPSVLTLDAARLGSIDLVTRAFASWSTAAGKPLALPLLSIASTMSELSIQTISDVVEIIGAVLFVILLSAPLPLFIFVQVQEKELRLDEMQLSMGVRAIPAQAVIFAINALVYGVIVALFWSIAGGYMQLRVMAHTSPLLLFATFVGHGLALVGTGSLVSAFVWDRQVATVLGVILGIVSPLIATSIMAGVYGRTLPWSLNTVPPAGLYAIPILGVQFALSRILYLATFSALAFKEPLTSSELNPATSEVGVAVFSLYVSAAAYAVLAAYLEQVLPRRYGTPQHFLFCVHRTWRARAAALITASCGRRGADIAHVLCGPASALSTDDDEPARHGLSLQSDSDAPFAHSSRWAQSAGLSAPAATSAYALGEDSDVFASRHLVDAEIWPSAVADPARCGAAYPIVIKNLRKEWPLATSVKRRDTNTTATADDAAPLLGVVEDGDGSSDVASALRLGGEGGLIDALPYKELEQRAMLARGVKVAVSDLSLAIPAGACFGLLGENGAGKTSTVAMLQGLYVPTGGGAFVGGFDIATEQQSVRLSLGIVPQFDVLWPTLTIGEHVLFYARVKGVPRASEAAAVQDILRRVGLADVSARRSDALSGGMRRRLSIACAMVGAPRVVLLDELTTGLDPASRRAVWRIITRARQAQPRAVFVVISHEMAEVEALCSGRKSSCAIMTHGRVRALGSVTRLRERYGGGVVLRVAFRADAAADSPRVADDALGAVLDDAAPTQAWVAARGLVERLFPVGDGSARVDGHVFQTRGRGASGNVVEAGSASFVLSAGSSASGAQVSIATAFRRLRAGVVAGGAVTSYAIEAQTLEAVFSRVVRHYRA
jgi:ABC-type multidrug transport system ATPase subunit